MIMRTKLKNSSLFLLIIVLLAGCSSKIEQKKTESSVRVVVKEILQEQQVEFLSYSGTIEADITVSLGFSVPGRITSVLVQEGERVHAGQLLATIETTEYEKAVVIANASLEQTADNYKRLNELYSKGSLPERDYITARSALSQATANKNLSAKHLADTKLYAPFSGIISAKLTEKGAMASPGVPAFTLLKTDQVYAGASIAESEINKLSIGKDALITIPVLNDSMNGKVSIINPQADNVSKTYIVKIRLKNDQGKLLPGMITEIQINSGKKKDVIVIPANAVVRDADDITYVFVIDKNRKAIRKRIVVSGILGDNDIIIGSGLNTGDKVVIAGQTKLEDGIGVQF